MWCWKQKNWCGDAPVSVWRTRSWRISQSFNDLSVPAASTASPSRVKATSFTADRSEEVTKSSAEMVPSWVPHTRTTPSVPHEAASDPPEENATLVPPPACTFWWCCSSLSCNKHTLPVSLFSNLNYVLLGCFDHKNAGLRISPFHSFVVLEGSSAKRRD